MEVAVKLILTNDGRQWTISRGARVVAEIYLDCWCQIDEVVLVESAPENDQVQVLRLATSHVLQFVKNRSVPMIGGILSAEYKNKNLTDADSCRLMDFACIPETVQAFDKKKMLEMLQYAQVSVISALYDTAALAISAVMAQVGVPSLRCAVVPRLRIVNNEVGLRFTVAKPERFTFWASMSKPRSESSSWNLYIIPSYHPVMNGKVGVGMINGATNACIRGSAIRFVFCPKAAKSNRHRTNIFTSWDGVKHPFCAIGRSVEIGLSMTKVRSKEGAFELVNVLRAALGKDDTYIEVSGGFREPIVCAHNRLIGLNRRSPWPDADHSGRGHLDRGSEAYCVWAYHTLKEEGVLDTSYVPSWFYKEGWLEIYEGVEVPPGRII